MSGRSCVGLCWEPTTSGLLTLVLLSYFDFSIGQALLHQLPWLAITAAVDAYEPNYVLYDNQL